MPQCLQLAAPMVRSWTGFNADETRLQFCEKLQKFPPTDPLTDYNCTLSIDPMNLKNRFRDIETDCANLAHGRLPSSGS